MTRLHRLSLKSRFAFCIVIGALALLLAGAGHLNERNRSRSVRIEETRAQCLSTAKRLLDSVGAEDRATWEKLARERPELCYQLVCGTLRSAQP